MQAKHVVIVGGVAGGAGAAARLRRNDEYADIVLLERGHFISFANCGLPYHIGGLIPDEDSLILQSPESFRAWFNVDVRIRHEVLRIDVHARTVRVLNHQNGESYDLAFDALILSPGARPIVPPLPGLDPACIGKGRIFTLRSLEDCTRITATLAARRAAHALQSGSQSAHTDFQLGPQSAVIIGAGFVGLEMAENFHHLGIKTAILEAGPQALAPLDPDMVASLHNHIRDMGIALHLGTTATGITPTAVQTEAGELEADIIILCVGVVPDTDFLRDSPLALGPRGEILVNERLETHVPGIYAVGDAISVPHIVTQAVQSMPLASPANKQARIVADVLCGKQAAYAGTQATAIARVGELVVGVTGANERSLRQHGMPYAKAIVQPSSHASYYPGSQPLLLKILFHPDTGRVYGAQAVGREGVDKRLDVLATALRAGMSVFDLQDCELAYAPPFSSAKDPVNMAAYVAGNIVLRRSEPLYVEDLSQLKADDVLIDIRTDEETAAGMIPGSLPIPLHMLRDALPSFCPNKRYNLVCRTGLRGHIGAEILRHHGLAVRNLIGGYALYEQITQDAARRG